MMLFKKIDSPELLQEVFKLRYQVYCNECQFLEPLDYPQGFESDALDDHAAHFGAFENDVLIGAVRLILPTSERFPIEERCAELTYDNNLFPRPFCAEVSRLTISKKFRRDINNELAGGGKSSGLLIRRVSPMALGLCHLMYEECTMRGIRYCLALMERPLWLLLKLNGFDFKPIGPETDFFGPVTPYIFYVNTFPHDGAS